MQQQSLLISFVSYDLFAQLLLQQRASPCQMQSLLSPNLPNPNIFIKKNDYVNYNHLSLFLFITIIIIVIILTYVISI